MMRRIVIALLVGVRMWASWSVVASLQVEDSSSCVCADEGDTDANKQVSTIRILSPGGPDFSFWDFIPARLERRAQAFYEKTGVNVEIQKVGNFDNLLNEMLSNGLTSVYDGYLFEPSVVGEVTEAGGLADLTEFVASSEELDWLDIFSFNRNLQAVYNKKVRSIPCDGDVLSLYYRKDLFDKYNLKAPRTWDEYTEIASFFQGREEPLNDGTNATKKIYGSCMDRGEKCLMTKYWFQLVHGTIVQSQGTNSGMLFDSETFSPNLGEGLAETLRHLENQIKYGPPDELRKDSDCIGINLDMLTSGSCSMTIYWGNVFQAHAFEGSILKGKLGTAPTPGSSRVLDRSTGKLVKCTEDVCPHGSTYDDIEDGGQPVRVNRAPYAAFGGWAVGVAEGLDTSRESLTAQFMAHVCGREESFKDVVVDLTSNNTIETGADPFRKSTSDVQKWVDRGYDRVATEAYLRTIEEQLSSPNTVLDVRFSTGWKFVAAFEQAIFDHLWDNKEKEVNHKTRLVVGNTIEAAWNKLIREYDDSQPSNALKLKALYQKSFNVYFPPEDSRSLTVGQIVGILVGCSLVVGLLIGMVIFHISLKRIAEEKRLAEELAAAQYACADDSDSEGSICIVEEKRDEKAEIEKLTKNETMHVIIWRVISAASIIALVLFTLCGPSSNRLSSKSFTTILLLLACLVAVSSFFYDNAMRTRTAIIVANAAQANAVVTNLYPGRFRDQILEERDVGLKVNKLNERNVGVKMKNFLTSGVNNDEGQKPLADLFLETTILFADVVGFTAWSSAREPSMVFRLLETVFSKFDQIASRRGIVKIETVGDCYVAAVGLPDPRVDHAVAMARFARDILKAMTVLTKELEESLGLGTAELSLRVGMHSGSVTGGILRGSRSRFQLFGDTVNTTARIEATGLPNKIHLSQECAELIRAGGKSEWLQPRTSMVSAKGKGDLNTYWLVKDKTRRGSAHSNTSGDTDLSTDLGTSPHDRKERLVVWHTDQLVNLLKQVVARRETERQNTRLQAPDPPSSIPIERNGVSLLDEVKEIVELPEYAAFNNEISPDEVEIPRQVYTEITNYIHAVSQLYRENAFHNWEHASSVTLSVLKLLSRIVAPSDLEAEGESLHDFTYGITSDPLTQFAVVFSAIIHDADHCGAPNATLVKELAPVVQKYGDRSAAEINSLVLCWDILMKDEFSAFRNLLCATKSELDRFRDLVVNCVMATDIVDKDLKNLRNERWEKAFMAKESNLDPPRLAVNRKATIVIEHLIQASDVSHTMQHWHIYRKWNERFFRECYGNYLSGRAENDPSVGWYKGELGFFDFYIIPLAKKLKECGVFGKSSDELLNFALSNRREWEAKGQEVVNEMMEAIEEWEAKGQEVVNEMMEAIA